MKRYKLLKDLTQFNNNAFVHIPQNTILTRHNVHPLGTVSWNENPLYQDVQTGVTFPEKFMQNNPEWFEEVKEPDTQKWVNDLIKALSDMIRDKAGCIESPLKPHPTGLDYQGLSEQEKQVVTAMRKMRLVTGRYKIVIDKFNLPLIEQYITEKN